PRRPPSPPPFPYTTLFRSEGLRAGLTQLGMQEGRDVSLDIRFTRGDLRAVSTAVEELAKARVDLIFANGAVAARAAKAATLTIPDRKSTRLNSSHVAISYA